MLHFSYIFNLVIGSIGLILFITTYTYMDKLEKIGCPCAESPYKSFIKNFCIAAIVYFAIMMLIPHETMVRMFGPIGAMVLIIVGIIFTIMFFVFNVVAFKYTNNLIREKCKCSEDVRREALYYWSIIEIFIFSIAIILPLFLSILGMGIAIIMSSVNHLNDSASLARDMVVNPVKNITKIPASIKSSAKAASKLMRKRR